MPNKPISIEFTSDTDKYERGLKDAEKATKKLGDEIEDLPASSGKASREVSDDFDRLGDAAGEAGRETGSEFRQNLGESLASGGSVSDLFTDTIGGLVASMPGQFAGVATVVGAGALLVFNRVAGQIQKFNQDIADQATSMWGTIFDQLNGQIGETQIALNKNLIVQAELSRLWSESPDEMKKLVEQANALAINSNDVLLARAGDEDAIRRVNTALKESEDRTNNYLGATSEVIGAHDGIRKAIDVGNNSLDVAKARMDAYNQSTEDAAATTDLIRTRIDAWQNGIVATQDEVKILAAGLDGLPKEIQTKVNVTLTSSGAKNLETFHQLNPYGVGGGGSSAYTNRKGASP